MYPCLLPASEKIYRGVEATDINGTVFQAQILKSMSLPWSSNVLLNAPEGESFWNVWAVPQAFHWIVLWLLTRVLSPVLALNYWLLIGWIASGVAAYCLARFLKSSISGSIFAGLLVESLPWLREKLITHMAYVFLCIPIFAVLLILKHFERPTRKSTLGVFSYITFVFFFDLYWFYFVLIIFALVTGIHFKLLIKKYQNFSRRIFLNSFILASIGLTVFGGSNYVKSLTTKRNAFGRPLEPTTNEYINEFNGSALRFISLWSDHFVFYSKRLNIQRVDADQVIYGGVSIALICIIGVVFIRFLDLHREKNFLLTLFCAMYFVLLAIPTHISSPFGSIPTPVAALKYVMPGVRRFARSGLVTEALLCIVAAVVLDRIQLKIQNLNVRKLCLAFVMICCIIDLSPFSLRTARPAYLEYAGVRSDLRDEESPIVYSFSPNLDSANFLGVRSVRRSYDHGWNRDFEVQAGLGDENFASFLISRGVTHVLIPDQEGNSGSYFAKWGLSSSIDLKFPDRFYERIPTKPNGKPTILYKVEKGSFDNYCLHCKRYQLDWTGVRQAFFDPVTAVISPDQQTSVNLSWVLPTESPSVTVTTDSADDSLFIVGFDLVAAYGPNAQPQIVQISSNIESKNFMVEAGSTTKAEIRTSANKSISIRHFLPCTVPANIEPGNPDTRKICFGVTGIHVSQLEFGD
jgi:hypothetical protein